MTELIKPWIVGRLQAAFEGRPSDIVTTSSGEVAVSNPKKPFVQLLQVLTLDPTVTAIVSDKDVKIEAEFTKSAIAALQKQLPKKLLTAYGHATFHLLRYKLVFEGSSTVLYNEGETFAQQLVARTAAREDKNVDLSMSRARSTLRLIVEDVKYTSGDANPIVGKPRSASRHQDIRTILQRIPVKELRFPALPASRLMTLSNEESIRQSPDSPARSSSPFFATQAKPRSYRCSDDDGDDAGVVLRQGGERQGAAISKSRPPAPSVSKQDKRKSKKEKRADNYVDLEFPGTTSPTFTVRSLANAAVAAGTPTSSPPIGHQIDPQASKPIPAVGLVAGWSDMTEMNMEVTRVPKDQRKKLEKSGSWWPPTGSQCASGYDQIPKVQLVPNSRPPRVRTVAVEEPTLPGSPPQSEKPSEEQYESDATEYFPWSASSPITQPPRDLNMPPPSSFDMPSSPIQTQKSLCPQHASQLSVQPAASKENDEEIPEVAKGVDTNPANDKSYPEAKPELDSDFEVSTQVMKEMLQSGAKDRSPTPEEPEIDQPQMSFDASGSATSVDGAKEADKISKVRTTSRKSSGSASVSGEERRTSKRVTKSATQVSESSSSLSARGEGPRSQRVTRASNGISKSAQTPSTQEQKKTQKKGEQENRSARKRAARKSTRSPRNKENSEPPPPARRSPSEEPPFPVKNPHGVTPVDKYGTLGAQQVLKWKEEQSRRRNREKLKQRLSGQYIFVSDNEQDDEDWMKGEEADEDTQDADMKEPPPPEAASQPVAAAPTVVISRRPAYNADDDEDDFLSAPAVPLGQKPASAAGALQKTSNAVILNAVTAPPPSTAPSLGPVVQVKETPARRAASVSGSPAAVKICFDGARGPGGEDRIPATHEPPPESSMESRDEVLDGQPASSMPNDSSMESQDTIPDRQPTSFVVFSQKSSTTDDSEVKSPGIKTQVTIAAAAATAAAAPNKDTNTRIEVPRTQSPTKKVLKSASFGTQELRSEVDVPRVLEEQYRNFLSRNVVRPWSTTVSSVPESSPPAQPTATTKKRPSTSSQALPLPQALKKAKTADSALSDTDSDVIEAYAPPPLEANAGVLYVPKAKQPDTKGQGKQKKKEKQPEMYGGLRPRVLAGEDHLTPAQKQELDRRRREFLGTDQPPLKPYISTDTVVTSAFTRLERERQRQLERQREEERNKSKDKWWLEDDTPMKKFVRQFQGLKALRKEMGLLDEEA
ncbi:hypothetical protein FN846DRAFT_892534 [Sphaerosporella brunnea]|uniref:Shelterin complex subunit TPP1/Est3 domain-containing protein n=1 Tax=Sphaerosporella brunnea TaxID=1250544 RepID=A0A5J5EQ81_9PEZI|nr:hypothetical protein FN846DRAFT_892534 [Sphaerosporella brunnea]